MGRLASVPADFAYGGNEQNLTSFGFVIFFFGIILSITTVLGGGSSFTTEDQLLTEMEECF